MVFKLARKTIFVLILNLILSFNLIVIMCLFFFLDIIKVYGGKVISLCFLFLIMLYI